VVNIITSFKSFQKASFNLAVMVKGKYVKKKISVSQRTGHKYSVTKTEKNENSL
jgi:hypothetical protein